MEADGFRLVQRGRTSRQRGTAEGADGGAGEDEDMGDVGSVQADADGAGGGAGTIDGGGANDADGADGVAEGPPDPSQLRQRWHDEVALVKKLARQGLDPQHPAMRAAYAARDAAEHEWRQHKDPAPLATRMGWAQRRYDRAVALQSRTRESLEELDKDYEQRKADLLEKLAVDKERTAKRRRELEVLQDEAGGERPRRRTEGDEGAIRRACEQTCAAMRQHVGPGLTALAEQLDTGSAAWTTLTGIVSTLNASHDALQHAVDCTGADAQRFDIGGDGDDDSAWSESHDLRAADAWAEGTTAAPAAGAAAAAQQQRQQRDSGAEAVDGCMAHRQQQLQQHVHWHPQWQPQPWYWQHQGYQGQAQHGHMADATDTRQQDAAQQAADSAGRYGDSGDDDTMGVHEWSRWGRDGWNADAGAKWQPCGHGKWQRSSWADAWESEQQGDHGAPLSRGEEAGEPSRKNRRLVGDGGGDAQAQAPTEQGGVGSADGAGAAAAAAAEADRTRSEMLSCIVARAIACGVQPVTPTGEDIQLLGTDQLAAWAAENLPSE